MKTPWSQGWGQQKKNGGNQGCHQRLKIGVTSSSSWISLLSGDGTASITTKKHVLVVCLFTNTKNISTVWILAVCLSSWDRLTVIFMTFLKQRCIKTIGFQSAPQLLADLLFLPIWLHSSCHEITLFQGWPWDISGWSWTEADDHSLQTRRSHRRTAWLTN